MRLRGVLAAVVVAVAAMVVASADVDAQIFPASGVIEGHVTLWGTGEPVEGALVRGWYSYGWAYDYTDADGYYRLEIMEPDDYRVYFMRSGPGDPFWYYPGTYYSSEATLFTITDDEVYSGIDAAVQDGGTMIGRVTDDTTGLPIAGVCADVHGYHDVLLGTAVSNDGGWLLYPGIEVVGDWPESSARIYDCNNLGYADEWYRDIPIDRGGGSSLVKYLTNLGRFDAKIGPPATIAGTVTDDGGVPLEGICVSLDYGTVDYAAMETGAGGYFGFADLTAGDRYVLDFEDCNDPVAYRSLLGVGAAAVSGTTTYFDQVLEPTASISGTVADASTGLPLEGICVLGTAEWFMSSRFDIDTTDAAGVYSLAVPSTTDHQYVRAYWCGDTPRPYEEQWWDGVTTFEEASDLQIGDGEHRTGVDLALPKMASLQGTLTGADGLPAETYIWLDPQFEGAQWWPRGWSNTDGSYRIDNIEAGPYHVRLGSDGPTSTYLPEWYDDVVAEEDAIAVVFDWAEVVTIDAELEQVGVVEWDFVVDWEANPTLCAYLTDTDGQTLAEASDRFDRHFTVGGLAAGDYLLYAEDCDTADPEVAPVWYPNAATRSGAAVLSIDGDVNDLGDWFLSGDIPGPSTVSGMTTRDGASFNACVIVLDEDLAVVGETVAAGGTFTVDDLVLHGPESTLLVKAEDCGDPTVTAWYGGGSQQDAVEIPFGLGLDWTGIEIEMPAAATHDLTMVVEDLLGRPLADVCVALSGDALAQGKTGTDGVASFAVEAGDYTVTAGVAGTGCVTAYEEAVVAVLVSGPTDVSLALALPTAFTDTGDMVFAADIEWLGGAGITLGCNPPANDEFCPDQVVTRGQMAAFLVRALGLTARLDDPFGDDDGSVFEASIEKLAAAGITTGCNPPTNDRFCPEAPVTREQMAAFLVRALGYTDAGDGDLFADDDSSIFEADIDRLATAGVTRGCNPPVNDRFCPGEVVTRGQMAAFLRRALG